MNSSLRGNPAWADQTWTEAAERDPARTIALLPLGAVEAHGPHLALATDSIISAAMAEAAAAHLAAEGLEPVILPALDYAAAPFAAAFPGTLSVRPETVTALIVDIGRALNGRARVLALANAHLDPAHLESIHAAVEELSSAPATLPVFPDLTRKPWALRLTDEFKSGACHAGRFEGSIVMAARPEAVREAVQSSLESNPASLSTAIRQGVTSFEEAGGPQAYFGSPAEATASEGRATITTLGSILADAVLEAL